EPGARRRDVDRGVGRAEPRYHGRQRDDRRDHDRSAAAGRHAMGTPERPDLTRCGGVMAMRILKMPNAPTAPQALWRELLREPGAATATPALIKAPNSHGEFD